MAVLFISSLKNKELCVYILILWEYDNLTFLYNNI